MRRNTLNFVTDTVTLLVMLSMIATGLLIRYVLPPGSRGGSGLSLWGWTRHDWGDLHFWLAVSLGALLLVHVALHWSWVCTTVKRFVRPEAPLVCTWRRNVYGGAFIALLAGLVGGFVWLASANVVRGATEPQHRQLRLGRADRDVAEIGPGGGRAGNQSAAANGARQERRLSGGEGARGGRGGGGSRGGPGRG
ncbi:MAG: DUF4405 domain-containing protein [Phycisphaerae bacterium]|nr:DUF4405 domain-containing protein [Phycisphaerae bacterium]MCZ2398260.1 DUF4405 domain-containing protein [Phycisphaerae bacterium]